MTRFTLDTNILVYAADGNAGERHLRAYDIVDRAAQSSCILTLQALAEFFHAVTRKGLVPVDAARDQVKDWMEIFPVLTADADAIAAAMEAAALGRFGFWDAMLLATAARGGCAVALSEDMSDGARFGSIVVRNPLLGPTLPPDIEALVDGAS